MEIRHIKYFITVAQELHFGKAAARLNMSQPPLSQQISQLENEIGISLFKRTKRSVELTDAGNFFLEQSYQILEKLERACNDARSIHEGEVGRLIIGMTGSWSNKLLKLLRIYRSKFPNVEILLQQMSSVDQIKALQEKRIQIGILCPPFETDDINLRVIHTVPFYAALPSEHPFACGSFPLDPIKLKGESFIFSPRKGGPGYYDTIISLCNRAGFTPKISLEIEGIFNIITHVAMGMGVAFVSKLALEHPREGVVFREITDKEVTMKLSLATRKNEDSPMVNNFLMVFDNLYQLS
jgi:DNA-binding transcriptional LysR family regulator